MRADKTHSQAIRPARESADTVVVVDVGSARVACAVAELGHEQPKIIAAECATSFGIRGGEIVDLKRAGEAIRIAIEAAADKAEADVRTVVVGLSGDVKLSSARAVMDLDGERRLVGANDLKRLRNSVHADVSGGRRIVHRFDGPYSVGDLHGLDHPEGLSGERLEMHASFLSAAGDRLDNLLRAVRDADVDIEAVSLEPMSCSLGALSVDERALGAVVLDMGAGAFRGALWEGGRLRQIQIISRDGPGLQSGSGRCLANPQAAIGGMEGIVMALARRFRIAPATAERLMRTHGALGDEALANLPSYAEVAAVDGLGSVRVDTLELSRTIEELLSPVARALREGLSGYSAAHAVGVVLTGGGARIKGMCPWIARRFGGAPVRLGVPRWKVDENSKIPADLTDCAGCSLSGLISLGAEARSQMRKQRAPSVFSRFTEGLRRFSASF
jgi:cell division ATPase FtsA